MNGPIMLFLSTSKVSMRRSRLVASVLPLAAVVFCATAASAVTPTGVYVPTALTFTRPAGGNSVGRTGSAAQPFRDDVILDTVTFPGNVGFPGNAVYTVASSQARAMQAVRITNNGTYIGANTNAEFGALDNGGDGNATPFVKAGIVAEGAPLPLATQESTNPAIQQPAIRQAFGSLSLVEGIDGEGGPFQLTFIFQSSVSDSHPLVDDPRPEVLMFERGLNSNWQVEAIVGGTIDSPIFAPVPVVLDVTRNIAGTANDTDPWPSGIFIETSEITPSNQQLGAVAIDLNAFWGGGVAGTIYGLRVTTVDNTGPDLYGIFGLARDPVIQFGPIPPELEDPSSAVRFEEFAAHPSPAGNVLKWKTAWETDNLGFNIYQEDGSGSSARKRLNPSLIAGSALVAGAGRELRSGYEYSWLDRNGGGGAYWLEDVDLRGARAWHGPFYADASPNEDEAAGDNSPLLAELNSGEVESGVRTGSVLRAMPLPVARGGARQRDARNDVQLRLAGLNALKLSVREEGWYRVTGKELLEAGLSPRTQAARLRLYADGREVPISVRTAVNNRIAAKDTLEFYGLGLDTPSTDTRVYWLVVGEPGGLRIASQTSAAGIAPAASFTETVERVEHRIYFPSALNGEADNFFGPVVTGTPVEQPLTVPNPVGTQGGQALLSVSLQGATNLPTPGPDHRVRVSFNGTVVGEVAFDGKTVGSGEFPVAASSVVSGTNQVVLTALAGGEDVSLVRRVALTHQRGFAAAGNRLRLTAQAGQPVSISGFSKSNVRVVDVTDPFAPIGVAGQVAAVKGGFAFAGVVPSGLAGTRVLLAFADSAILEPYRVAVNTPSAWTTSTAGADLVCVGPADLLKSAHPLVQHRRLQGMTVASVNVEDVFDELSFGSKSPAALKAFLAAAGQRWVKKPRFALLVGDATYDPRNYLGRGANDRVPTAFVPTSYLETASDDWFADFNEDGVPEIAVGRLPVSTAKSAATVAKKIVGYDKPVGSVSWKKQLLLVSGKDTPDYPFTAALRSLRTQMPAGYGVTEARYQDQGLSAARTSFFNAIKAGALVVNYQGHGRQNGWSDDLLKAEDIATLRNETRLPLFVSMTCFNGTLQDPTILCLGTVLLRAPKGGAVAAWASSGLTVPSEQASMNQALYRELLGTKKTLGEAIMGAKSAALDPDVRRTWILFGDPSMTLR